MFWKHHGHHFFFYLTCIYIYIYIYIWTPSAWFAEKKSDVPHMQSFMLQKWFVFDPFMWFSKCHLKWKGDLQFERTTVELLFQSWSFEYSAYTFIMQKYTRLLRLNLSRVLKVFFYLLLLLLPKSTTLYGAEEGHFFAILEIIGQRKIWMWPSV